MFIYIHVYVDIGIFISKTFVLIVLQLHEFYQAYRFKIKLYLGVG